VVAGTTSSLLTDAFGNTIALADPSGAVQIENTYEPFGKTTATGISSTNPFQFTGRENDDTGLYYYRARYYHPTLQRFISEDPIELRGEDINLFSYVFNSPLNLTDPLGLQAVIPTPMGPLPFPGIPMPSNPLSPSQMRDMTDFFRDLLGQMTSPGNVVDTQVKEDYERYAAEERTCGRKPLDRCTWLRQNRNRYRIDQWRPTEKAWGCRGH